MNRPQKVSYWFNFMNHLQTAFLHVPVLFTKQSESLTGSRLGFSDGQRSKNVTHGFDRLQQLHVSLKKSLYIVGILVAEQTHV